MKKSNIKLIELVKKAQNGDKEAMKAIIERYTGLLRTMIKKNTKDSYMKEELIQEGALTIIDSVYSYTKDKRKRYSFDTYLRKNLNAKFDFVLNRDNNNILFDYNEVMSEQERSEEYVAPSSEDSDFEGDNQINEELVDIANLFVDDTMTCEVLLPEEVQNIVAQALEEAQISQRDKTIILAIFGIGCERLKLKDLAEMYNITPQAVEIIKCKALSKLRITPTIGKIKRENLTLTYSKKGW